MGYINDENDFMHTKYSQSAKPAIGFKQLGADFDMDNKKIFRLNTQADVAIDADLNTYALDLSSGVNKGYVKRQCLTKDAQGNDFDLGQCNIFNSEPFYPGLYNDTSLPNVEYVRLEDNKVKAELNNKLADKADLSTNDEQTFNSIINVPNFNQGYSNMSNVMNKEYIDSRDALKTDKSYSDNTYLKKITGTAMAKSIQNKIDKTLADSTYLTKPVGSALAQSLQTKIDINGSKSMQADLNMDDHNITNLKEPINDTDGANKKFVVDLVNQDKIKQSVIRKNVFSFTLNRSLWKTEFKTRNLSLIEKDFKIHHINLHLVSFEINREVKPGTNGLIYWYRGRMSSIGLTVIGTVVGSITLNPIVIGCLTGSGVLIHGYITKSNISDKVNKCKFAYTSYEKVCIQIKCFLRGLPSDENAFLTDLKVLDDIVIDQCPTVDEYVKKYYKKFTSE
ncbi:hypothetical protein ACROYT_G016686 [Oculina patagonica]